MLKLSFSPFSFFCSSFYLHLGLSLHGSLFNSSNLYLFIIVNLFHDFSLYLFLYISLSLFSLFQSWFNNFNYFSLCFSYFSLLFLFIFALFISISSCFSLLFLRLLYSVHSSGSVRQSNRYSSYASPSSRRLFNMSSLWNSFSFSPSISTT